MAVFEAVNNVAFVPNSNNMLSSKDQVKSIGLTVFPGLLPLKSGRKAIKQANPTDEKRSVLIEGEDWSPIKGGAEGRSSS